LSALHRLLSVLLLLGIGVEFFLAGAGAFGATSFHSHRVVGVVLLAGAVIVLVVAAASRRNPRIALGLAVLVGAQVLLGHLGRTHPWIGAVHGLTAGAVAAVASVNVRMAMADTRGDSYGQMKCAES
jgi:hypothetical protein